MRRESREIFPDQAGKGSLISSYEAETGLLWMWAGPSESSRVETGMSGNCLNCSKGVNDLLEFQSLEVISIVKPQRKWASSRLEGKTSWVFSSCGRCSRLTTGTSETRSGGLRNGQSPCELLAGPSGFLSLRCWGLRPCVEAGPEPEDSSPVLTWILGYFWSLPRGVSPRLEWGHARALFSRAVAAVSRFPSRGSRYLWLSLEAFPRGFPQGCPTCHRGVSRSSA